MSLSLIAILTFVACASAVVGVSHVVSDLFVRDRARLNARLHEEFGGDKETGPSSSRLFKDLSRIANESGVAAPNFRQRFNQMIEQSGVAVTAGRLMGIGGLLGLMMGAIGGAVVRHWLPAVLLAPLGFSLPYLWIYWMRKGRVQKLCEQLPEAFEIMGRAIRAGQTVPGAMQIVANDLEAPLGQEFAFCYEQQNLGISQDAALRGLARRTGVMELQIFVVALLIQRRSGGNLVELLNGLSTTIRKRLQLRGKVKAVTGEGRMQAAVLIVLPFVAFLALLLLNRAYAQILLDRPFVLAASLAAQAVGAVWIWRIVSIEY